jgi:phospholipase/carboxylesterase
MAEGLDALVHEVRPAAGEPAGALVLFHGRGTSEYDLLPLIGELDPDRRLLGVTPRGPLTLPPGGAHWYVVREIGYPDKETFDASFELASEFLDGLDVPIERTVIGGFSQGGVMAYALAFAEGRPRPRGLIALSCFMPTVEGLTLDLDGLDGFPVAIGHGAWDPVIEVDWGRRAREALERAGADVVYRESPMPHAVDPAFLEDLRPWLFELTQIER